MLHTSEARGEMVGIKSRANSGHGERPLRLWIILWPGSPIFQYPHKSMATQIRYPHLSRWCRLGATGLSVVRKEYILRGVRSFSSTRFFAQDTEPAPTHGFSNGQNLGSITLKKNGVYLESKLRIVSSINQRSTIDFLTEQTPFAELEVKERPGSESLRWDGKRLYFENAEGEDRTYV